MKWGRDREVIFVYPHFSSLQVEKPGIGIGLVCALIEFVDRQFLEHNRSAARKRLQYFILKAPARILLFRRRRQVLAHLLDKIFVEPVIVHIMSGRGGAQREQGEQQRAGPKDQGSQEASANPQNPRMIAAKRLQRRCSNPCDAQKHNHQQHDCPEAGIRAGIQTQQGHIETGKHGPPHVAGGHIQGINGEQTPDCQQRRHAMRLCIGKKPGRGKTGKSK